MSGSEYEIKIYSHKNSWAAGDQHFPESVRDYLESRNPKPSISIQDLDLINGPLNVNYSPQEDSLHGLPGDLNIQAIDVKINYLIHTITARLEDFLLHCPTLVKLHIRDPWPRANGPEYLNMNILRQQPLHSSLQISANVKAIPNPPKLQLQELVHEYYMPPRTRPISRWNPWTPLRLIDWSVLLHLELHGQRILLILEPTLDEVDSTLR